MRELSTFGTKRNLYFTDLRLDLALGVTQILGLASGVAHIFAYLDTNMLVSPTRNCSVGGLSQCRTQRKCFASQWNIGLRV